MSLIMDALKRAQQLRLKDCGIPPLLDASAVPKPTLPVLRKRKAPLLLSALAVLTAVFLGWGIFEPSALFRREEGKESAPPSSREKPSELTRPEAERPKFPPPDPERSQGKKNVAFEEKPKVRKGPPLMRSIRTVSGQPKGMASKETSPESAPQVEPVKEVTHSEVGRKPDLPSLQSSSRVDSRRLFNRALRYQEEGQLRKAMEAYAKVIEVDPTDSEAYNNLGLLYQEQGDSKKAQEAFKKALEIRPDYIKALNNLGILFYLEDRFDEAMDCFQRALSFSPNHVESHLHMGLVLKRKGDLEKALDAFEKALGLNPHHSETHYNLALLLEEVQQIDRAIEHYERFLQIASRDHPVLAAKVENHLQALRRMRRD